MAIKAAAIAASNRLTSVDLAVVPALKTFGWKPAIALTGADREIPAMTIASSSR
jgi:hypothetical protein